MSQCDSRDCRKARKIRSQLLPCMRKQRGCFYVVAFITTMGAVRCYDRRDRAFTSKIILLYGRISIRENSGNVTDAKNINVDRWKIEANLGHLDISSRLSCWLSTDIKEFYPQYIQLFSGTRNFFYFHDMPEWNLRLCRIIFFRIQPTY